ncbi:MAG: hypothetical protein HY070_05145 [Chloroflexi bacterium]|nr:hypothetical protein [Chloroflexota bacterium]
MQDRSSVIVFILILSVCCLGLYVALSGYLINTPPPLNSNPASANFAPPTVLVVISTSEAAKLPIVIAPVSTALAVPSPLGAFQTITAAITNARPTFTITPRIALPPTALPAQSGARCASFAFCPQDGPPDSRLAPTGAACPRNYIWGQIIDANGKGIPDIRIRFKDPNGEANFQTSKGPPEPIPGIYNIPTGQPGSTWEFWVVDSNGLDISPHVMMTTQAFSGAGNCPTRIDFVQRK